MPLPLRAAALLMLAVSCTPAAQAPRATTWHQDVAPIIDRKCATCHVAGGVAPFALSTLDDWQTYEVAALDAIRTRRMPPFPARTSCAEYSPTQALEGDQRETIERWLAEGKPAGAPQDFAPLPGAPDRLTRVDRSLPMAEPFTPTRRPDEYRCFLLDWPYGVPMSITGYELRPGQKELLHHADIFFISPDRVAEWMERDAADPGPGWECYDIPFAPEGGWIGTFVPGNRGVDFPEGTGLRVLPGSKVYLQMHYNTSVRPPAADLSVLDVRVEPKVKKPAGVQALSDPAWISRETMTIPAFDPDVTHRFEIDPAPFSPLITTQFIAGRPLKIYATTMHMHELGSRAKLEVVRADGGVDCVVDIPEWDFHWQLAYTLREPITVNPGDRVAVECSWDNSAQNQRVVNGVQAVSVARNWGTRTEDEMCVAGIYATQ